MSDSNWPDDVVYDDVTDARIMYEVREPVEFDLDGEPLRLEPGVDVLLREQAEGEEDRYSRVAPGYVAAFFTVAECGPVDELLVHEVRAFTYQRQDGTVVVGLGVAPEA